jgi:protocatechuate 3,4-dioxygenase beta subunit
VFPGCYDGRWPHVHFEIYPSLSSVMSSANKIATSQLAFPEDVCAEVYATSGYTNSASNLSRVSLASDGIFRDGYATQLATTSGDVTSGYTATLDVAVNG